MLVKVHALLWSGDRIVVHREHRQGDVLLTLPGGRVLDRERLEVAQRREVEEEIGARIVVRSLLYVAEVVHGHSVHDVTLVFGGELVTALPPDVLRLAPGSANGHVFPPILDVVAADGPDGPPTTRWLGNVWRSRE